VADDRYLDQKRCWRDISPEPARTKKDGDHYHMPVA
jgi:hypothetical protein